MKKKYKTISIQHTIFAHLNSTFVILLSCLMVVSSCKNFLEIDPPKDSATPKQVFENDAIATSAITGIYSRMAASGTFSGNSTSIATLSGLSADELKSYNLSLNDFFKNDIPTSSSSINGIWTDAYTYIYTTNAILEGLRLSSELTDNTKKQLEGEAKFVRAFCYFYLINLFGDVPLNLETDYRINQITAKSSKEKVYAQITTDLVDAENLLPSNYISIERVRPNKWAAKALLSRVYLYTEQWALASQKATEVIDQKSTYSLVDDLDKVFLKNSTETIWQIMPTAGSNTPEGALFILIATPPDVSLSPDLIPLFMTGDNRRTKWIGEYSNTTGKYYYPFKYKIRTTTTTSGITEYSMILRLAELHLIRAEARAKLALEGLSLEDINLIRKRAGLITPLVGLTADQCIVEVEKQRRLELFSEWGHRWLDLKRTNRASTVLSLKGTTWKDTDVLFPIPDSEIGTNPNVKQNTGY